VAGDLPEAVVVFGASGFVGRNVVEALRGRVGLLVGVSASGRAVPGCDRTVAAEALATVPALPARAAIVHVAAFRYFASRFARQQAEILSANLALTDLVYRFALERGVAEVRAASSAAVYPADWAVQDDARPLDLNAWPHEGESAYAWSKRWGEVAAELWHRRAGVNTISLRLTNPYGPFDTLDEAEAHVATAFVLRALSDVPEFEVRGDPEAERDFVFAGDVAAAFVESLRLTGVQAAVNCAAGETARVIDLARAAMRAAGRERPIRTNPPPPGANAGVKVRRATAARLREVIPGLPPFRGMEEGLRPTVDWYRDVLR
jgi:nucleoside-diphosphate-sugar epimerase